MKTWWQVAQCKQKWRTTKMEQCSETCHWVCWPNSSFLLLLLLLVPQFAASSVSRTLTYPVPRRLFSPFLLFFLEFPNEWDRTQALLLQVLVTCWLSLVWPDPLQSVRGHQHNIQVLHAATIVAGQSDHSKVVVNAHTRLHLWILSSLAGLADSRAVPK